jgi:hypothetical protein
MIAKVKSDAADSVSAALVASAAVQKNLDEYRIEAAQNFVSQKNLADLEARLVSAIERLGDRLDKVLDDRTHRRST